EANIPTGRDLTGSGKRLSHAIMQAQLIVATALFSNDPLARWQREGSVMLQRSFEARSKLIRRNQGVPHSFPPISHARPPTVPSPLSAFLLVPLWTLPLRRPHPAPIPAHR